MPDSPAPLILEPEAALAIRREIQRADGREVCFLAGVSSDRRIIEPRAVARGNINAVVAAARDAQQGDILVHNHPSGNLDPSLADLTLATRVYEEGLGTAIVDNQARRLYVVVEPPAARERVLLDPLELDAIVAPGGILASIHQGYEDRPAQRQMLREVIRSYNEGGISIVEAGTGTGKSLAYLLPAAMWALRNGERTVVSTHTINLQEQLVGKDLALVNDLVGDELRWSLVKGRGNYVSIRRLLLASQTAPTLFERDRASEMDGLLEWSRTTRDGSLSDLSNTPSDEVWEEVRSDGDICMGTRCPHFQECFYQRSRRNVSAAHILVVNHALLFSDLALRRAAQNWTHSAVLPPYRHLILDEGHNVEDAATSHLGTEVTRAGILRSLDRLDRSGKGVLAAVETALIGIEAVGTSRRLLDRISERIRPGVGRVRESTHAFFLYLEPILPQSQDDPLVLGRGHPRDPTQDPVGSEHLASLAAELSRLCRDLRELRSEIEDDPHLMDRLEGRILDLKSLDRRLDTAREALGIVLGPTSNGGALVRWIETASGATRGLRNVRLAAAPVEPGSLLGTTLYPHLETAIVTSATLAVGEEDFRFIRERLGLSDSDRLLAAPDAADEHLGGVFTEGNGGGSYDGEANPPLPVKESILYSPFDYETQVIFCVPTDLPGQDAGPDFQVATARVVHEFARVTGGGIFVLFTSHRALRIVASNLRDAGVDRTWPILVHGEAPRSRLLSEFVRSGHAVLLGTSSFWEGVDVPGRPLRGVVLQKIPFRVPTEPITQARMEALERRGQNAFRSYLVPLAALRLKQGFGRLVRSRRDRGGILLLDDRILRKHYGRMLRSSLPAAPLVKGPWKEVRTRLEMFYTADE